MNEWAKKGFTIIEIVIVLAIAGLIFLMIFLGLPALQRSQRDIARKNDVAIVASSIKLWQANNRGRPPSEIGRSISGSRTDEEYDDNASNMVTYSAIPNGPLDSYLSLDKDINKGAGSLSGNTERVMVYSDTNTSGHKTSTVRYKYDPKKPFTNIIRVFTGFRCPDHGTRHGSTRSGGRYIIIPRDELGRAAIVAFLEGGGYYCQDI